MCVHVCMCIRTSVCMHVCVGGGKRVGHVRNNACTSVCPCIYVPMTSVSLELLDIASLVYFP